ncbi:MAG: glycosyltransferase family 2 protein [Patescibacteria group bacterium]|jgi:GT2 family glycosyltransferase
MNKKVAIILGNIGDYAKKYSPELLPSLRTQNCIYEIKIFIYDNATSEESTRYLKEIVPEAEIIRNKDNDGFAKGNNDVIKKALEQGFDYIALFNMDTVLEQDCLRKMVEAIESEKKIGAVQARLMLYENKNKINSLGNITHFLGFGYSDGYGEEYKSPQPPLLKGVEICYPSGAAVLFKREALEKVGLFDEEFWMYNEDQDLGWRIWLAGFKCVLAPEAVVYHKYEFSRSIKKYYWMDRNRIIAILKNYRLATLILIFPAFLVMEIGLIFFAVSGGWFKEKINVYKYFLSLKNWRYILEAREQTQKLRRVKDRDIIKLFSGRIWYQEIGDARLRVANVVFGTYWRIIRVLIKW